MTITPSPLYGPNIYLCSLWSPLVEFSTGGVLWKTKTQPKQPKTMTGVGEPRGGYQLLDRFPLFSPINQLLHHLLSRSSLHQLPKQKTYTWKSIPKKCDPELWRNISPPSKQKNKKQNNPKCQRKNEQSRRETEKIEDPKPTTHTHTQPAPPSSSRVPLSLVSMAKRRRRKNREKEKRDGREW